MQITSHVFLLLFIPLTLAGYYWLTKTPRQKMFFLLGVSLIFYAFAGVQFIPALLGLSLATYLAGKWGKFGLGVLINLAALLLFKYLDFGIQNVNAVLAVLKISFAVGFLRLVVPLGLSFFIFKHIGYLLDVQQKRYPASTDFWAFATFSAYFPQISAGPISSFGETASQFATLPDRLNNEQVKSSLIYISMGLAKKILIADTIGTLLRSPVNQVGGFSGLIPAWYLVIAYAVQLYFDFSGYTDMTLGISSLFGVRLPENFNNPYLATNPMEFWQRWHISLSAWFRIYIFSPLSRTLLKTWGTEKREWAQYAANIVTMSLVGLWHGANLGFLLWGLYHGLGLNIHAWWQRQNRVLPVNMERMLFLFAALLGWAFFMSPNNGYLIHLLSQLFGFGGMGSLQQMTTLAKSNASLALLVAIPLTFSGSAEAANFEGEMPVNRFMLIALGIIAAICILLIERKSSFIYVQF